MRSDVKGCSRGFCRLRNPSSGGNNGTSRTTTTTTTTRFTRPTGSTHTHTHVGIASTRDSMTIGRMAEITNFDDEHGSESSRWTYIYIYMSVPESVGLGGLGIG